MQKKIRLNKFEEKIEKDILNYKPISPEKHNEIKNIVRKTNEKRNISLRVNGQDLALLKLRAEKEGIPYQTFISSILHKFITDQLLEQEDIAKSIQLIKFSS